MEHVNVPCDHMKLLIYSLNLHGSMGVEIDTQDDIWITCKKCNALLIVYPRRCASITWPEV